MLTDTQRKIYLILWHRSRGEEVHIDTKTYARLSGRSEALIRGTLTELAELRQIEWNPDTCYAKIIDTQMIRPASAVKPWWEWD